MITRDVESWEAAFLEHQEERQLARETEYPSELLEIWSVKGKGEFSSAGKSGGGGKKEKKTAAAATPADTGEYANFYESMPTISGADDDLNDDSQRSLLETPRVSTSDTLGDTRSLDRAYQHRLVLLVKGSGLAGSSLHSATTTTASSSSSSSSSWGLPSGPARAGEPLVQAAERIVRKMFGGDTHFEVWYPGVAPVGHWLEVYPPEVAAAKQCYGERHFFYRAEILGGRFRLPEPGTPPREGCPYSDFNWVTRDESESLLPRPIYKYLHQIMGGGAGEEAARSAAWRARLEKKGWSVARGTAVRAKRVAAAKAAYTRQRALATREQCLIASAPFASPAASTTAIPQSRNLQAMSARDKLTALASLVDRYHERKREQAARAKEMRTSLASRPRVEAIRAALAASRSPPTPPSPQQA